MKCAIALVMITTLVGCQHSLRQYRIEYNYVSGHLWPGKPATVGIVVEKDTVQAVNDSEAYAMAYVHRAIQLRADEQRARDKNAIFHINIQVFTMDGKQVKSLSSNTLKKIDETTQLKDYK